MSCRFRYFHEHIQVYSPEGEFLFSADTREEAMRFLEEYQQEQPD